MITINYQGRYGNNLFQYMTSCILSKKFNQEIQNPMSSKIINYSNYNFSKKFNNTIQVNDDNILKILEIENLESNIILNGFFQNYEIIELFEYNRNYFINDLDTKKSQVFLHVRLGDLLEDDYSNRRYMSLEYYQDILKKISFDGGFISSDSINHHIITNLKSEFNLQEFNSNEEDTILFASTFEYKILSLGTFSWWMGFLGCQDNVFFPNPSKYRKWHGNIHNNKNWKLI